MRKEKIVISYKDGAIQIKGRMSNQHLIQAAADLTAIELNRRQNPVKKRGFFRTIRKFFRTLHRMAQPPKPQHIEMRQPLFIEANYVE